MPLSEHEQRLLDQMEQALFNEDPKFASHMVNDPSKVRTRRKIIIGALVLVVGLGLVVLGVVTQQIWMGGVGFAVMVAGGGYALTPSRRRTLGAVGDDGSLKLHHAQGKKRHARASGTDAGSFMERLEHRWDRRRGDQGW